MMRPASTRELVDARRVILPNYMYSVYVLKSENFPKSYVGMTDNLKRRLREHNNGHSFYTKRYLPWIVVHKEEYNNRIEARQREKYLKSAAGRKYLRNKVFNNFV
jgi:putative endonuclease